MKVCKVKEYYCTKVKELDNYRLRVCDNYMRNLTHKGPSHLPSKNILKMLLSKSDKQIFI